MRRAGLDAQPAPRAGAVRRAASPGRPRPRLERYHLRESVAAGAAGPFERTFTLKELVRRAEEFGPRRPDEPLAAWLRRLRPGRRLGDLVGVDDRGRRRRPVRPLRPRVRADRATSWPASSTGWPTSSHRRPTPRTADADRDRVRPCRLRAEGAPDRHARAPGHDVDDLGTDSEEPVDYPPICAAVGRAVRRRGRPRHRARRQRPGRADRRQQGAAASAPRCATTCTPPGCRAPAQRRQRAVDGRAIVAPGLADEILELWLDDTASRAAATPAASPRSPPLNNLAVLVRRQVQQPPPVGVRGLGYSPAWGSSTASSGPRRRWRRWRRRRPCRQR